MNKYIIEKYIQKLTKEDIYKYGIKQNITLTNNEINYLYMTIKKDYKTFLLGDTNELFYNLKNNVRYNVYSKIIELYNIYKDKI